MSMSLWVLARQVHGRYVAHVCSCALLTVAHVCSCALSTVAHSYVVREDIHELMGTFVRIFVRI